MAGQPITWKTLAAPDLGTSVAAVNQGAQNIATGLNTLGNVGNSIRNTNIAVDDQLIKDDTNKVLAGLANIQSKDEWDAMKASGELNPDKISSLAPRADLGLVAQALEAKDKDIEATVTQGINNLYNTTQIQESEARIASRLQENAFSRQDRKSEAIVTEVEADLLQGNRDAAIDKAGNDPEALKTVAAFDEKLRTENYKAMLNANDFDGAVSLATTEAERLNVETQRKDFNLNQYYSQVATTGEATIPENLTPTEKLDYASKAIEANKVRLTNLDTIKQLKNIEMVSELEEPLTQSILNNDFETAREVVINSGLKGKELANQLNTVKQAEDNYKVEQYKAVKSTATDITNNIYSELVSGNVTDREALNALENYLSNSNLSAEDATKLRANFTTKLDNFSKLTPTEQNRIKTQTDNLEVEKDTAMQKLEIEYERAKQDYPVLIPKSELSDDFYELNVTKTLNEGLVPKYKNDLIEFGENDSDIQDMSQNIRNFVDKNQELKGVPAYLIDKGIEEAIDASKSGWFSNFDESTFETDVKDRITKYAELWKQNEANRKAFAKAEKTYLDNLTKVKKDFNSSKAEIEILGNPTNTKAFNLNRDPTNRNLPEQRLRNYSEAEGRVRGSS